MTDIRFQGIRLGRRSLGMTDTDKNRVAVSAAAPGKPSRSRLIARLVGGEAMVAAAGLAVAGILLLATAGSAWWTARTYRETVIAQSLERAQSVGELLARGVEAHLNSGDLTGARVLLTESAVRDELSVCRVLLPDGSPLADAYLDAKSLRPLPEDWPRPTADGPAARALMLDSQAVSSTTEIRVGTHGPALLELAMPIRLPAWTDWKAQAGIGASGVVGMALLLCVYRVMRRRLGAIGHVRDALLTSNDPAAPIEALLVRDELGPEARAWNSVIHERDELRQTVSSSRAVSTLTMGTRRDADLSGACDALWQGLLLVDSTLKVRYANGAAAVLLRAKKDQLAGADAASVFTNPQILDAVRGVAKGTIKQRLSVEVKGQDESRPDGGGVLRFGVRPVRRDDTASAMIIIEDVTQQRVADEARNAFVAQATHELRTPLTNIRLYIETLIEGDKDGMPAPDRARALNVINQESVRLERIVGDMLSVAEIEAGSLKLRKDDVRLDVFFKELQDDYGAQASDKEIALNFLLPPKFPVIHADRDKLSLAMHNLIGNGLKYTPQGGTVNVRVGADNSQLTVEVEDNGIGIKPEEHELVFEKFYRAKDRRIGSITGSGLGLAIARDVARMHGGDITIRSELDKGTTFTFSLPLAA